MTPIHDRISINMSSFMGASLAESADRWRAIMLTGALRRALGA
jgi:hypothetical protein